MTDIFDRAIARLEKNGLWQNNASSYCGGTCLMLSIVDAADGEILYLDSVYQPIFEVLGVTSYQQALDWNDAPGRTLEEVADVLRRAKELSR